jgi:hypothetical protein
MPMTSLLSKWSPLFEANGHLLLIALFGGVVLYFYTLYGHLTGTRRSQLKGRSLVICFFVFLFVALPFLGAAVTAIYIANGDKLSPLLAFQVGLTSPAVVHGIISLGANRLAAEPMPTQPGQ